MTDNKQTVVFKYPSVKDQAKQMLVASALTAGLIGTIYAGANVIAAVENWKQRRLEKKSLKIVKS